MSVAGNLGSLRAQTVRDILAAAPPGSILDDATRDRLRQLAQALVVASPESREELERYIGVTRREIAIPRDRLREEIEGRTVLVTGSSGCIASVLLEELAALRPGRVIGVDLVPPRSHAAIDYRQLDICDRPALEAVMRETAPDIVFHLAAQRDPGLAERQERETIRTNIFGTLSVIDACAEGGAAKLVFASTGKALRYFTREVYAASKRIAEFLVSDAASRRTVRASAVRFTHVVDNSLVVDKFRTACRNQGLIRVHDADAVFYIQSAREAAQLLLAAAISPATDGLDLLAIRNLDWPVSVLDLAIGIIGQEGTAPLQIAGYDAGYAERQYQGLYDPQVCGDVSPLFNALEGAEVTPSVSPDVDRVERCVRLPPAFLQRLVQLESACHGVESKPRLRSLLDGISRELLEVTLELGPESTLERVAMLTKSYRGEMSDTNRWLDDRIRAWAARRGGRHARVNTARGARA
jgi:nucleoside-diphosphate-sugar epimerase